MRLPTLLFVTASLALFGATVTAAVETTGQDPAGTQQVTQGNAQSGQGMAAPAAAPAPDPPSDAYRIGPQDEIQVFVWKEPELSTSVTVRPDGRITLPLAGEIDAAGKTAQQLKADVVTQLQQYVEQPVVTVMVKAANSLQVSVLGEVKRPGRYRIGEKSTILDAVALGGGFTEYAHPRDVVVFRRTRYGIRKLPVNVKHLLTTGEDAFLLEPGDTVYVH